MFDLIVILIPLFPLLAVLANGLNVMLGHRFSDEVAHRLAWGSVLASFLCSLWVFVQILSDPAPHTVIAYRWFFGGDLAVNLGFLIDPLTCVMMLVVTGVGFLIHVYSVGYMHGEEGFTRFFAYMNLFMVSMLLLVMGNNYAVLFIGWEGVGLCSYLLIGYYYDRVSAAKAATKAFVVKRIGDAGFLLAIFLVFVNFKTLDYTQVFAQVGQLSPEMATAIALCLLVGAIGKSAQVPLYTWLPDAMEGPTPVSALIHAATMVTAGVYMVVRNHVLYDLSPVALNAVAWVGGVTALFAATIGLVQTDIKRVLAYSTVSQLGYMFLAVGLGAYAAGIFHLVTHAFFKALLFLGAGSVIHGLGGEQDLRKMGGLSSRMVTTTITTTVGGLGLAGVPGLAGFFSKDEILAAAFHGGHLAIWGLLLLGAFLTAFYTSRLLFLAFYSDPRMSREAAHHVHESPSVMTLPLWVLAVLTVVAGLAVGIPSERGTRLARFLEPVFPLHGESPDGSIAYTLLIVSVIAVAAGFAVAWFVYLSSPVRAETIGRPRTPLHALLLNAYYVDRLYDWIFVRPFFRLSTVLARAFDLGVIDRAVNGLGGAVVAWAAATRRLQTGYVVNYALTMLAGAVLVVAFLLSR